MSPFSIRPRHSESLTPGRGYRSDGIEERIDGMMQATVAVASPVRIGHPL